MVGAVVSAVATFALTAAVTNTLTQASAGTFFTVTAIFMLSQSFAQLGTNAGLVFFLSSSRAHHSANGRAYMHVASRPVLLASLAISAAIILAAPALSSQVDPENSEQFRNFLLPIAILLPFAAAYHLALSGTRGLGTMKVHALLENVSRPSLQVVGVSLILVLGYEDLTAWAWALVYAPLSVLAWRWWRRRAQVLGLSWSGTPPWRSFWSFSLPRALVNVTQMAMQRLDVVLVGMIAGLPQAAIYAAASRFIALGSVAANSIGLSTQPLIREKLALGETKPARQLYSTATTWLMLLSWPIFLTLITSGHLLLRVFGPGYTEGALALALVAAAMLVATACGTVDAVLMMAGKSSWTLANILVGFAVNLSIDLMLIPRLGFLGAAIGWAVAILIVNLLPLIQLVIWHEMHPFGAGNAWAAGVTALCFGVLPGTAMLVGVNVVTHIVVLVLAIVLYALALWVLRSPLHLTHFLHLAGRRKRRRGAGAS